MSMEPWTAAHPPSGCGRGSMGAQVSGVEARPVPEVSGAEPASSRLAPSHLLPLGWAGLTAAVTADT